MDIRPQRRFQFGMLTLLVLIAACAIAMTFVRYWRYRRPYDVRQVRLGMDDREIVDLLGQNAALRHGASGADFVYEYDWGNLVVHFGGGDGCDVISYYLHSEDRWFELKADGTSIASGPPPNP